MQEEFELFIKAVEAAFANVEYPGDDHIVVKTDVVVDDRDTIYDSFKGKHWRDLTMDILIENREHIVFLTPHGYQFFLPAF
jgi:hypothetical protein